MIKLFFVTDIHGSNVCYRKFLNALPIYGVDVAVLMGDLTGKVLVPLVEKGNDTWECTLMGQYRLIETKDQLAEIKKITENAGYYWVHQTREEFDATRADPGKIDALFKQLVLERVQEWLDLADERLEGKPFQMFMAPGNDDWFVIDDMIDAAKLVHPCDRRHRRPGRSRGDHELGLEPDAVGHPARDERGRRREAPLRAVRPGQELRDRDLQLPRPAERLLARPLPEAGREPDDGRRREDPRRQHRRQEGRSSSTSRSSACTATSTSRAAPRRPAARCSSTPAASTRRASSRAPSSCSTRRRSRTTSSLPGDTVAETGMTRSTTKRVPERGR